MKPDLIYRIKEVSRIWALTLGIALCLQIEAHQPPPPTQEMVDDHWRELHARDLTETEQQMQIVAKAMDSFLQGVNEASTNYPPQPK